MKATEGYEKGMW